MRGRSQLWLLVLAAILVSVVAEAQTRRNHRRRHRGEVSAPTRHRERAPRVRRRRGTPDATTASNVPPAAPEQPATPAPTPVVATPTPVVATPAPVPPPAPATPQPVAIAANGALVAPLVAPEEHDARPVVALPGTVPSNPYRAGRTLGRRFGRVMEDEIVAALRNGPAGGRLRNYGNTSVNIRVDFPGPIDGSFKPSERLHEEHWRAEIAAFRLNQLLGLERVPPAVFRRVPQEELPNGANYGVFFERGTAFGAMIYWVPVLRPSGVGSPESLTYWSARLRAGAPLADNERRRAEEVSSLIVFDFLIANWDRWNGLNTLEDGDGRLVYRDNNAGFQVPLRTGRYARVEHWLHESQRFSRGLIASAQALTLESMRDAMADDSEGEHPLLTDAQILGVLQRRDTLLRYVRALIRLHGEHEVLYFE